ncbi:MAG: hypothetical protein ACRD6B_15920 [Bryobacteraceae bacterium]
MSGAGAGIGGGGGGEVSSVFGRRGVVVADSGDYAVAQVTGAQAAPATSVTTYGFNSVATGNYSYATALGFSASTNFEAATALGGLSHAGEYCTAVGYQTSAKSQGATAIGTDSTGIGAVSNVKDHMVLGTSLTTVDCPGALTVAGAPVVAPPAPASTVTGPDAYGAASGVGTGVAYARNDHNHGLPAAPTPSQNTAPTPSVLNVSSGVAFQPSATQDTMIYGQDIPAAGGVVVITMGPSTGSEYTVGQFQSDYGYPVLRVPVGWQVVMSQTTSTHGTTFLIVPL